MITYSLDLQRTCEAFQVMKFQSTNILPQRHRVLPRFRSQGAIYGKLPALQRIICAAVTLTILICIINSACFARRKSDLCSEMSAWRFRKISGLTVIVTGLEHSGTSILARLVRSTPSSYGAFECGVLLSSSPSTLPHISPFYDWLSMPATHRMWNLSKESVSRMSMCPCHAHAYAFLREHSMLMKNYSFIVDKTPRYVYYLSTVMSRSPGVPVFVIVKSIQTQYKSFLDRGWNSTKALEKIRDAEVAVKNARLAFPERILIVRYEELCRNPNEVMRKLFFFLGIRWHSSYLAMTEFNSKLMLHGGGSELPFLSRCHRSQNISLPC